MESFFFDVLFGPSVIVWFVVVFSYFPSVVNPGTFVSKNCKKRFMEFSVGCVGVYSRSHLLRK